MKRISFALAVSLSALAASGAVAATKIVDDSVFGVDTVLRDKDNNRDFLRLDLTMGYGLNAISAEFGSGGDFEGWSVASTAMMNGLAAAAGVTHGSSDPAQVAIAEAIRDFFCPAGTCVNLSSSHEYARGLVSDQALSPGNPDAYTIGRRFNVTPEEVDFRISGFDPSGGVTTSEEVWLTRAAPAVPVPAAGVLLVAALGGLGVFKRRAAA